MLPFYTRNKIETIQNSILNCKFKREREFFCLLNLLLNFQNPEIYIIIYFIILMFYLIILSVFQ